MKIVAISDTHGLHGLVPELPEADVFIHAGDFMNSGRYVDEVLSFNNWLDSLTIPRERRLIVAGNHDLRFDETHHQSSPKVAAKARELLSNCVYLQDQETTINGVKFYFSPWTPRFFNWGFNADRGAEIKKHWDKIPDDVEVLVTHGPPIGILDTVAPRQTPRLGCQDLYNRVKELKHLKYHIFGHIHASRGQTVYRMEGKMVDPVFVNASFLNEDYRPHSGPGHFLLEI
jgi:Icc-related predicted phosphoesterase